MDEIYFYAGKKGNERRAKIRNIPAMETYRNRTATVPQKMQG
jgi:hypothetical protein